LSGAMDWSVRRLRKWYRKPLLEESDTLRISVHPPWCASELEREGSFLRCFRHGNAVSFFPARYMSAKKSDIACFVEVPARKDGCARCPTYTRRPCRQCRETQHRRSAVAAEPGLISTGHRRAIPPPRRAARAGDRAGQAHRARRSRLVPSLCENVECIAVAADDVVRLHYFFLEAGIVRREQVATLRSFD